MEGMRNPAPGRPSMGYSAQAFFCADLFFLPHVSLISHKTSQIHVYCYDYISLGKKDLELPSPTSK